MRKKMTTTTENINMDITRWWFFQSFDFTFSAAMLRKRNGVICRRRPIIGRGQPASQFGEPLGTIFVSQKSSFMSLVQRVIKILDQGPGGAKWSATKVLPLGERIRDNQASLEARVDGRSDPVGKNYATTAREVRTVRQRQVFLVASGHAIEKLVLLAAWFQQHHEGAYVIEVRTRWSATVDDLVMPVEMAAAAATIGRKANDDKNDKSATGNGTGENDGQHGIRKAVLERQHEQDQPSEEPERDEGLEWPRHEARLRHVNCLEVAVRLA